MRSKKLNGIPAPGHSHSRNTASPRRARLIKVPANKASAGESVVKMDLLVPVERQCYMIRRWVKKIVTLLVVLRLAPTVSVYPETTVQQLFCGRASRLTEDISPEAFDR